ncbi:MAG: VOC family protein [Chloroflexi bacterium]|nr:VOC family protein [Chloroflexota bacterium]
MAEVSQHEPGMFNWVDLMTTDVESAKEFYSQLLGCETVDNPVSDDFVYTLFSRNGKNIAGLSPMMPDMLEQGVPPHWNSYVAVVNVEEAAAKAARLGGTMIMPPMDVMEFGRMTSIIDPTGAVLNLWEAKAHIGADLIGEAGAFCWAELYTHDTEAASKFYAGLFGWAVEQVPGAGGMPYNLFTSGGAPAAGMLAIQPIWGEVPPNWTVYFAVENLDAALEKVQAMGGSMQIQPMSIPGIGRISLITDPQHVYVMLIELDQAA